MSLDPTAGGPVAGQIVAGNTLSRNIWQNSVVGPLAYLERRIAPQMIAVSGTMDHEQTLGDGDLPDLPTLGFYGPSECICASFMMERDDFDVAHYHHSFVADYTRVSGVDVRATIDAASHVDGAAGVTVTYPEFAAYSNATQDISGETGLGVTAGAESQRASDAQVSTSPSRPTTGAQVEAIRYSAEVRQVAPYLVILR